MRRLIGRDRAVISRKTGKAALVMIMSMREGDLEDDLVADEENGDDDEDDDEDDLGQYFDEK